MSPTPMSTTITVAPTSRTSVRRAELTAEARRRLWKKPGLIGSPPGDRPFGEPASAVIFVLLVPLPSARTGRHRQSTAVCHSVRTAALLSHATGLPFPEGRSLYESKLSHLMVRLAAGIVL